MKLKKPRWFNLAVNMVSHRTGSCVYTYIKAVTNCVMLQLHLLHNFYRIILKIRYNYIRISAYPSTGANTQSCVLSPEDGSRINCKNIVLLIIKWQRQLSYIEGRSSGRGGGFKWERVVWPLEWQSGSSGKINTFKQKKIYIFFSRSTNFKILSQIKGNCISI